MNQVLSKPSPMEPFDYDTWVRPLTDLEAFKSLGEERV